MATVNKPVLAVSDLTAASDDAIRHAGQIAESLKTDLYILHAMGLHRRSIREVFGDLHHVDTTLDGVEQSVRRQVLRVVDTSVKVQPALVHFDDLRHALPLIVNEIDPALVVLAPPREAWLSSLPAPVVIVGEQERQFEAMDEPAQLSA